MRIALLLLLLATSSGVAWGEPPPQRLVLATWNLEWFFDDNQGDNYQQLAREQSAPSRADWEWKRDAAAAVIAGIKPDILALQEVENQQVLYYLTQRLRSHHALRYRIAFVQGADFYTEQDVALLYRDSLVEIGMWRAGPEQRADKELFSVNKHLFAHFQWENANGGGGGDAPARLTVVTAHFRASADNVAIRRRQARQMRAWLGQLDARDRQNIVVLGDFNTEFHGGDWVGTEMEILTGRDTPSPRDDLVDLHDRLPAGQRDTHLSGKQFDRVLVSPGLAGPPDAAGWTVRKVARLKSLVVRGEPDKTHWAAPYYSIPAAERDVSDHYPVVVELERP